VMVRRLLSWMRTHPRLTVAGAVLGTALAVLGFVWFEPHKLFVDERVNEAPPAAAAPPVTPAPAGSSPSSPAGPTVLSRGAFRPLEHDAKGRALVLETPDGGRHLRFEDLEVSNGPDLVVYLSVLGADQGWHDADDAEFVDLGALKGNLGDQNYELPAGVDLSRFRSVVIWCRRFTVGFAVAPISVGR
jgi:hypothetical protein